MKKEDLRNVIVNIIAKIEPDGDINTIEDSAPLRDQLELDSMDFLDIVLEIRKRYKIKIPEEDYPELQTMDSTINYLLPKLSPSS